MTRLKGIMINGEWLGERVIVNNCFRSICAISPIIMLEAVKLINKIDYKHDVFEVKGFEFLTTDTIQIYFEGKKLKGLVDLTFGVKDSELFLKSSFLDIKPLCEEDSTGIIQSEPFKLLKKEPVEEKPSSQEEVSEIINTKVEEVATVTDDAFDTALQTENSTEKINNLVTSDNDIPFETEKSCESSVSEEKNVAEEIFDKEDVLLKSSKSVAEENKPSVNDLKKDLVNRSIVLDADTLLSKLEKYNTQEKSSESAQKDVCAESEPAFEKEEQILDKNSIKVEKAETNDVFDEPKEAALSDNISMENVVSEEFVSEYSTDIITNKSNEEFTDINTDFDADVNADAMQADKQDEFSENVDDIISDIKIEKTDIIENEHVQNIRLDIISNEISIAENLEEGIVEDNHVVTERACADETIFEEVSDENAEECLMDFYHTEVGEKASSDEKDIDEILEDEVVVQAMLSEMVALKEELDILKNTPLKNDFKEAFWNGMKNNKAQVISDEDADFKILSTNEKINAAILDNNSFFAGEKVYKWGDTLYLNE